MKQHKIVCWSEKRTKRFGTYRVPVVRVRHTKTCVCPSVTNRNAVKATA